MLARARELRVANSVPRLKALGYEIVWWEEPPREPEKSSVRFVDVIPEFSKIERLRNATLYKHQVEAMEALEAGKNIVLTAKTGSGKTEAWALPAIKHRWKVLAIYPTLALSADQIQRLETYYAALGDRDAVLRVDRPTLDRFGGERFRRKLVGAKIVVTNPAFLLADIKRMAHGRGLLEDFLRELDLIVVDELDFYGPRGAHLILAMIQLLSEHLSSKPPRVAVLTATLGNPDELASYLTRITGRETKIIRGNPFSPKNRYIIVLGKGVDALKDYIRAYSSVIASRAPWIVELLDDEEEFREHLYEIYEALEAIGLRPPRPGLDPVEILASLVEADEDGVTLVFTRSIRHAEKLYRSLRERLGDKASKIAVHHHLVSKSKREEIERAAREGRLKMIITVRTLAQGIDIGTIVRVVHIGLPTDLREYQQREGRKGRRKNIPVTESIIVPAGLWDRKLLEAGSSALRQWIELPLEKVYINPKNKYALIFRALWKLFRNLPLEDEEEKILLEYGLAEETTDYLSGGRRLKASEKGIRFWRDIGFYEHGPPYGYRKYLYVRGRELRVGEEASIRDVVEKYQPGAFDPSTDALVVDVDPKKYRVVEESIEDALARSWIARAASLYEDVKRGWGEKPDLANDMKYGRVYTLVALNVRAPASGFGELEEQPIDVEWVIESRRPRLARGAEGRTRVYHETFTVKLGAPVKGRYIDYTYGYSFEAPATISSDDLRLGLTMLIVFLRLNPKYAIPLTLLQYHVLSAGSVNLIYLWEREAAGIIEELDWLRVAEEVERYRFPALAIPLAAAVDLTSALRLIRGEVSLETAARLAALAARVIAGHQQIRLGNLVIEHPRPSKSHGIASLVVLHETVQLESRQMQVLAIAAYNGENHITVTCRGETSLTTAREFAQKLLEVVDKLLAEGFKIYIHGVEQHNLLRRLLATSYIGISLLRQAEAEGKLVDIGSKLAEKLGSTPLLANLTPKIHDYAEWVQRAKRARDLDELETALKVLAKTLAETLYKVTLALEKGRIAISSKK
ncbi:MAG TPA: DEAD/DEAH box helicase [Pyrodictium sp.]|nr:DEAD/DEAH box helicase [Pyrodictium sp.]